MQPVGTLYTSPSPYIHSDNTLVVPTQQQITPIWNWMAPFGNETPNSNYGPNFYTAQSSQGDQFTPYQINYYAPYYPNANWPTPAESYPSITGNNNNNLASPTPLFNLPNSTVATQPLQITNSPLQKPFNEEPPTETTSNKKQKKTSKSYSEAIDLAKQGLLKHVEIETRPDKLADLPLAKLITKDDQSIETTLPVQYQPFLEQLDTQKTSYAFSEFKPSIVQRSKNFLEQVMKDSIAPTVILGVTGLVGLGVWQYIIKPLQQKAPVENALKNAIKNFDEVKHTVDDQLQYYDAPVKDAVNKFRNHQKDFLLFLGPPGTGKSHLMEALGKEVSKQKGTVALFANVEAGDTEQDSRSVRDLLTQIFSGNKETTEKALGILNKIAGTKVKELIVMANEFEQFSDVMNKVIVNGMGNPTAPIKLRILATGNELPGLDAAANNRIQGGITYVDYTTPDRMTSLIQSVLSKTYPQVATPASKKQLQQLLTQYPGYSTRTIIEDIIKPMKEEASKQPVSNPIKAFEKRLINQKLNDSEIAGLLRQLINERLQLEEKNNPQGSIFSKEGVMLLNRKMMREAQRSTQNLGVELLMNGKQLKTLMGSIIDQLPQQNGLVPIHIPPRTTSEYIQVLEAVKNDLNQCKLVADKKPPSLTATTKEPKV